MRAISGVGFLRGKLTARPAGAVTKKRVDGGVLIEYTPYDRNHNLLTEKDGVKVDAWETMDPSVHFSFVIPYETYVLYKILSSAVE